ncbi:SPOR domain-containing protein [Luteibacter aegosomatissinici]|nr:SPOR domain-containing protein [Luteibacter aegosomatissinici]UPG96759.1 SPOR domain-containing protein [Luteibacter aegosomatissinici]
MTNASVGDALPPVAGGQGSGIVTSRGAESARPASTGTPSPAALGAARAPSADIQAPVGTSIPVAKPAAAAPSGATAAVGAASSATPNNPSSPAAVPGKPTIYLQVGAFSDVANANRVADQLNRAGLGPVSVIETSLGGRNVRRVRVGPLADVDTADKVTDQIAGMGLPRPSVAVD